MVKKVHKHVAYGRTTNHSDGYGYMHYTKGFRFSTLNSKTMEKGMNYILNFLKKAVPLK